MIGDTDALRFRTPDHEIEPIFPERWSPRAMSGEALEQSELNRLFEAARWAPSSFNAQPWRFLYAHRAGAHWPQFFGLLGERNQLWCANAAVLVVLLARAHLEHNDKPSRTHAFDCGAAWANLALQGARMGLVVHGMAGLDYERAASELNVPDKFAVQCMIAIGHPGSADRLPEEMRAKEQPSGRKTVAEIAKEGGFPI